MNGIDSSTVRRSSFRLGLSPLSLFSVFTAFSWPLLWMDVWYCSSKRHVHCALSYSFMLILLLMELHIDVMFVYTAVLGGMICCFMLSILLLLGVLPHCIT